MIVNGATLHFLSQNLLLKSACELADLQRGTIAKEKLIESVYVLIKT